MLRSLVGSEMCIRDRASQIVEVPVFHDEIQFVRPEEAQGTARSILEQIRQDAELPFVSQVYQALARWPDYLDLAYHDLKPYFNTIDYSQELIEIRNRAGVAMAELPGPVYFSVEDVDRVIDDTDLPRVRELVELFHCLSPGLTLNLAFFQAGLQRYPPPPTSPIT